VLLYSKSEVLVSIFFFNTTFLTYLIGPTLYLYTRSILTDNSRLKKSDYLHFIPALVFLIASLPHLFLTWSYKMEIAAKIVDNSQFMIIYNSYSFHGLISGLVVFLSRPILAFGYLVWSVILFVKFYKFRNQSRVLSHQLFIFKWLIVLFSFFSILIISHAVQIIQSYAIQNVIVFYITSILQFISGIGLIGLLISPFFFPAILYGLPQIPIPALMKTVAEKEPTPTSTEAKSQPYEFEKDYLLLIKQKVEVCMSELQPYLQPDCNLAYFAKLVKLPAHHLAYYFREEKKQAFNDYRNEWRVNHAKKLIEDGKTVELTLEAIGLLSGFSTRNTFFIAFKKVEDISPSAYVARLTK
jgi:AraC-like DNA-binding protein